MPEQNHIGKQSYTNNEASTTIQEYRVAVLDTTENGMKLPGAAKTGDIVGVTEADVEAGETGTVIFSGIAYVTAYAAFSLGAQLVIGDTAGRVAAKASGATDQGLGIVGLALRAAGAQGDVVPCMLQIRNEYSS